MYDKQLSFFPTCIITRLSWIIGLKNILNIQVYWFIYAHWSFETSVYIYFVVTDIFSTILFRGLDGIDTESHFMCNKL